MSKTKLDRSSVFSSLLGDIEPISRQLQEVELERIDLNPRQPRRYIDKVSLSKLSTSIKEKGVLEPILLRPVGERYQIIAGERRSRAARDAGHSHIPALIMDVSDNEAHELAIIENLQRDNLNPLEETLAILDLLAVRLNTDRDGVILVLNQQANAKRKVTDNVVRKNEWTTIEGVFASVGRLTPEAFRSHRLPLLKLPIDIMEALQKGQLQYTKAREVAKLKDAKAREKLLKQVIKEDLSLSEIKARRKSVEASGEPGAGKSARGQSSALLQSVRRRLTAKQIDRLPKTQQRKLERLLTELVSLLSAAPDKSKQGKETT